MARRFVAALFLAASLAVPLLAHELGLVQVEAMFKKDGTYDVDLLVDREHLPLQVSGAAMSPDAFLRGIESSAVLSFDDKPAAHGIPEVGTVEGKPNVTRLRLTGRTPAAVSRFTFADNAILGFFVIKLRSEGREGTVTQWVDGGKSSPSYPLDRAVVPLTRWEIVNLYLRLGYTHILPRGLDHVFGLPFRKKSWYRQRIVIPGSLLIAAVGLYWSVQRVFFAA
jgi:hypothetical protein